MFAEERRKREAEASVYAEEATLRCLQASFESHAVNYVEKCDAAEQLERLNFYNQREADTKLEAEARAAAKGAGRHGGGREEGEEEKEAKEAFRS